MDQIISIISNLGFPIFVAVYLLVKIVPIFGSLDSTLKKLTEFLDNVLRK
jgi:hypothetical protein